MDYINIFAYGTDEYKRLEKVARVLTDISEHDTTYRVEDIYFDFGQNWMWTTIVAYAKDGTSWQALSPAEQEKALTAPTTLSATSAVVNSHSWNTYCVDKH